ncbi:MAG: hypothetical protein J5I90_08690 [Caldilineales bacterium]|nr:hypothetical protein [Caldilineales bacterium]
MATPIQYILKDKYGNSRYGNDAYSTVEYGKCLRAPYSQSDLWFVTIRGKSWDEQRHEKEFSLLPDLPEEDMTYLVTEEHARLATIDKFGRAPHLWDRISHKTFVGWWCPYWERLWKDVLVYEFELDPWTSVKYGYCHNWLGQNAENRELWFVCIENVFTFIVDHICANQEFIRRMGSDPAKWLIISWGLFTPGEIDCDGVSDSGYLRTRNGPALTMAYMPPTIDDIETRVSSYENSFADFLRWYDRGWKKKKKTEWNSLDYQDQLQLLRSWSEEVNHPILRDALNPHRR